jgi:hypothetical protein
MSKRDYLTEKQEKSRTTARGIILLMIFIVIFIAVILRIAIRSDRNGGFFSSTPTGQNAYEMAKAFIKPTLKSSDIEFHDDEYESSTNSDSVYKITSYFDTKDSYGTAVKTNFTATLKYKGGSPMDERDWTLIKLDEH